MVATHNPQHSASDTVFWGVVHGLEHQQFVPGQRLVEADLSQKFSVGRNAVREAIQRLAAEGVISQSRHKGATIRILSQQEALDLLDIIEKIFGLLTRYATRGHRNDTYHTQLKQAYEALQKADQARDPLAFSAARRCFYRTLLAMGNSQDIRRLFTTLHIHLLYAQQHLPVLQKIRMQDYARITRKVLAGHPDEAEQAGIQHVSNVRRALLNHSLYDA